MAKTNTVKVTEEVITVIPTGKDNTLIKTTSDGRGVRIENKTGSIFIPFGAEGKTIVDNIKGRVDKAVVGKGKRRTAAEIKAQSALAGASPKTTKAKK